MNNLIDDVKKQYETFMDGRYGMDPLNGALLGGSVIAFLLSRFLHFHFLKTIALVAFAVLVYRWISKSKEARRQENVKFENWAAEMKSRHEQRAEKSKDENSEITVIECPFCHEPLNVPHDRLGGKIRCSSCNGVFDSDSSVR